MAKGFLLGIDGCPIDTASGWRMTDGEIEQVAREAGRDDDMSGFTGRADDG